MRNYEILERIYKKCPDFQNEDYDFDELYDCCLEIKKIIAKERPAITKGEKEFSRIVDDAGVDIKTGKFSG